MAGLRIAFMGTPDFAVPALAALIEAGHEVVCVYSQPPRPKGRGHKLQPSPVHAFADKKAIEVRTPTSIKGAEEQQAFADLNIDVAVVAAYGLILPKAILDAPKHGCLNIHASILPRWRGASPIQHAIWKGDEHSGVTIMQMEEGLDTGPMIEVSSIALTPETTSNSLHDELAVLGSEMICDVVERLSLGGELHAMPQDDGYSTYAPMLKKEDGQIDWSTSADEISAQVRSLNPWPGVYTNMNDQRVKILEATVTPVPYPDYIGLLCGEGEKAGALLDKKGLVLCGGRTILQITKMQPAGKSAMDVSSAINGGYLKEGDQFS